MRIFRIIKEIINYFFVLRIIRRNKNTADWKKHKLVNNWFGTIGTVINLPPDVFSGEEIYYQVYVIEQMKPVNAYLESLNLQEVVSPNVKSLIDKERGIYAYLITYKPLFRDFTFMWAFWRALVVSTIVFLNYRYDVMSKVWSYLKMIPDAIIKLLDYIFI